MNENQKQIYNSLFLHCKFNREDYDIPTGQELIHALRDLYDDFEPCMWRVNDDDLIAALEVFLREVKE